MTALNKRQLLSALVGMGAASAVGWAPPARARDALSGVDAASAADIGRAWLGRTSESRTALERRLFPEGVSPAAIQRLGEAARADFDRGALFVHRGWRLSETEARICALLALQAG